MKENGIKHRDTQERDAVCSNHCFEKAEHTNVIYLDYVNRESNASLITETAFSEACYIFLFAWNSNETDLAATCASTVGSRKLLEDLKILCKHLGEHLSSSDKEWDMVASSPQLYE